MFIDFTANFIFTQTVMEIRKQITIAYKQMMDGKPLEHVRYGQKEHVTLQRDITTTDSS